MDRVLPRTLSGFMELPPDKQALMEKIFDTLRRTYSLYGFAPLDTPAIEAAEVLLAKGGGETEKQIYRFSKGDSDLALRFDLTVPLAKYVAANYGRLTFPFRRYQIGKVWRGERAQRGRFREFYQADIDIIGDGSLNVVNEAEIPAVICHTFTSLGLEHFTIRINNRKILNGFFEITGLGEKSGEIMRAVDKIDKVGAEKVRDMIVEEISDCNICSPHAVAQEVIRFIGFEGGTKEKIAFLRGYEGRSAVFDEGINELSTVILLLPSLGVPEDNFEIDLTIARGLDYYTGTVYETIINDHPEIGSVCSGGRYDNLAEYYTDRKLPGVGISIGVTRLFYVLDEQNMFNTELLTAPADVLVVPMTNDLSAAAEMATSLRSLGVRTQLYTEDKKFSKKISYADKLGIPFIVIIGEDELRAGVVSIKNLETGQQTTLPAELAAHEIKAALKEKNGLHIIKE
ncbi:MAG: histidine--tRNA ligase [Clostridia bacterium]|nr:histidine--tRNA ligase [Clostridia bacterium]